MIGPVSGYEMPVASPAMTKKLPESICLLYIKTGRQDNCNLGPRVLPKEPSWAQVGNVTLPAVTFHGRVPIRVRGETRLIAERNVKEVIKNHR
jgi:hypothetical protein